MSSAAAIACQEVSLRSYPKRLAASEEHSAMDTSRTGGSTGSYSADAVR